MAREKETVGEKVLSWTRKVMKKFPVRQAGNKELAVYLHDEFKKCGGVTSINPFTFHPSAFLGYLTLSTPIILAASISLFLGHPIMALVGWGVFGAIVVCEFLLYLHLTDFLYNYTTGYNVVSTILPKKEIKRVVILSSHSDAARRFRYLEIHPVIYIILLGTYTLTFIVGLFACPLGIILGVSLWMKILAIVTVVAHTPFLWFLKKGYAPGAGDNLVSVGVVREMLEKWEGKLKSTMVIGISFDAEESGICGSAAFCKEFSIDSLPVVNINMDSLFDNGTLAVVTKDLNGTVTTDKKLNQKLREVASSLGIELKNFQLMVGTGSTDGANFTKAGIPSTSLIAIKIDPGKPVIYHTFRDTCDAVDSEVLTDVVNIINGYIEDVDRDGE